MYGGLLLFDILIEEINPIVKIWGGKSGAGGKKTGSLDDVVRTLVWFKVLRPSKRIKWGT